MAFATKVRWEEGQFQHLKSTSNKLKSLKFWIWHVQADSLQRLGQLFKQQQQQQQQQQ